MVFFDKEWVPHSLFSFAWVWESFAHHSVFSNSTDLEIADARKRMLSQLSGPQERKAFELWVEREANATAKAIIHSGPTKEEFFARVHNCDYYSPPELGNLWHLLD